MIKILKYSDLDFAALDRRMSIQSSDDVDKSVDIILSSVKIHGDDAVIDYTAQYDGVRLDNLIVSAEEITEAISYFDQSFLNILQEAAENIRDFHAKQIRTGYSITDKRGIVLGQRITAIEKVGIYVPGGTASYPSTVLMNAVPAKLAGVEQLVMCTPPGKDGKIAPAILAAAHISGVDIIFRCGGAQAIAAMAFGTESIPKVYKIVGPGNIYVATAKRKVFGLVDIDMIAGPSDILVLADDRANPVNIAADMLAQAEHDRLASAVLVTTSAKLAGLVRDEIESQLKILPRAEIASDAIENGSMIVICDNTSDTIDCINHIAPEHLEIYTENPFAILGEIKNAGSIFLGGYAPEALGDYFAGPNHTLPTMGTARFSSPLSVDDFVKKSSYTYYSREALAAVSEKIASFARMEGLEAHARSVEVRNDEIS